MSGLLNLVIFLPSIGALLTLMIGGNDEYEQLNAKRLGLFTTLVTLGFSMPLLTGFQSDYTDFQFLYEARWIGFLDYRVAVDGISLPFVLLTTFLMPIAILACWGVSHRVKDYIACFLFLETLLIGAFCALDLALFYLFFEGALIPMFLIVGVWGGPKRVYAAFKFFLYTLLGSLLMLVAMVAIYSEAGTTNIIELLEYPFPTETINAFGFDIIGGMQMLLWAAFFASFAVKVPMWPVHTWLPDAHVEAPTAGSVILAAILLKIGGYGFLRFSLPMFPVASDMAASFVLTLSAIAVIYGSLVALAQEDMKKLIAYSSVAHMGFVTMGIFAFNQQALDGAIFQMVSHGFISAALFFCVGIIYERTHSRMISSHGGLARSMPRYAAIFMLFTMANVGLPGTSGFVGEFLSLAGVFQVSQPTAIIGALGVVLSAAYALWLYRRVFFENYSNPSLAALPDLTRIEFLALIPLVLCTLIFGFYPSLLLDLIGPSVNMLLDNVRISQEVFLIERDLQAF